jgi:superfamily I DNA/RNA helicase
LLVLRHGFYLFDYMEDKRIMKRQWTQEQEEIIQYDWKDGNRVVVNAFAGTGKTFTILEHIANTPPDQKVLYLAFNNKVVADVSQRVSFGDQAIFQTYHRMALDFVQQKLGIFGDIQVQSHIVLDEEIWKHLPQSDDLWKLLVAETLECYFKDEFALEPSVEHAQVVLHSVSERKKIQLSDTYAMELCNQTRKTWEMIKQSSNYLTFSGIIKWFCSCGQESRDWIKLKCTRIIIDESQDIQAVFMQWLLSLTDMPIMFVGDMHQSIYGWNGAKNAMMAASHQSRMFHLSRSFRFGSEVALLATKLLHAIQEIAPSQKIIGNEDNITTIHTIDYPISIVPTILLHTPCVVLCRSNVGILECVSRCLLQPSLQICIEGDLKKAASKIEQLLFLSEQERDSLLENIEAIQKENHIQSGQSLLTEEEKTVMDGLRMIRRLGVSAANELVKRKEGQKVSICTVHAAKGLEWDHVFLWNDFPCFHALLGLGGFERSGKNFFCGACQGWCSASKTKELLKKEQKNGEHYDEKREEIHLLYVALTRARTRLFIPAPIDKLLRTTDAFSTSWAPLPCCPPQCEKNPEKIPLLGNTDGLQ